MVQIKKHPNPARARYRKNFYRPVRKQTKVIHKFDKVFLSVKRNNKEDIMQKCSPVAEGLFNITEADEQKVDI